MVGTPAADRLRLAVHSACVRFRAGKFKVLRRGERLRTRWETRSPEWNTGVMERALQRSSTGKDVDPLSSKRSLGLFTFWGRTWRSGRNRINSPFLARFGAGLEFALNRALEIDQSSHSHNLLIRELASRIFLGLATDPCDQLSASSATPYARSTALRPIRSFAATSSGDSFAMPRMTRTKRHSTSS